MLNYELKFLTCDESVNVKNVDFKTSKYQTRKKSEETVYDKGKRSYHERRGSLWRAPRPRVLRELESKLRDRNVVFCEWMNETVIIIVFSSGSIAYLTIHPDNLDLQQILFDRYCVGKLFGQNITGVVFSTTHILFTHSESIATLVTFTKNTTRGVLCRIADKNPHIQSIELADGARRAERRISWSEFPTSSGSSSSQGPRVLVWTAAGADPAPWTPATEIRVNLHLYQIKGTQMNVIAYHQLENETLTAEVSRLHHNIVHIVEQNTCHKSGVTLTWLRYDISQTETTLRVSAHRAGETRVRLPAAARSAARSQCDRRLLVACIDGSVHALGSAVTHSVRAGFIPTWVRWSGELALCAEDSRVQVLDRALAPLQHNAKCIHLAHHFKTTPHMRVLSSQSVKGGALLLLMFTGGPLALLRVTHPQLPQGWIRAGRVSRAVSWLRALDWEHESLACLRALQDIFKEIRRSPLTSSGEATLQAALETQTAACPALLALRRGFFHMLLRRGRLEKAVRIGTATGCGDLLQDARWAVRARAHPRLPPDLLHNGDIESECSTSCSCSQSSDSETSECHETCPPPLPRVQPPSTMPVAINLPETSTTNSIRPNFHQYLERDLTIWSTEIKSTGIENKSTSHMELKEKPRWRSMDDVLEGRKSIEDESYVFKKEREFRYQKYPGRMEKNVKFSDTVTVNVMPESHNNPVPSRELAESLPLCAPHAYLADFEPAPGTNDYVEV